MKIEINPVENKVTFSNNHGYELRIDDGEPQILGKTALRFRIDKLITDLR